MTVRSATGSCPSAYGELDCANGTEGETDGRPRPLAAAAPPLPVGPFLNVTFMAPLAA